MKTKLLIRKYGELSEDLYDEINGLINNEFGDIPIVQQYSWAVPDWTVILSDGKNNVLTFYNIVLRKVRFDDANVEVAGINNVITPKEYRGNGFSTHTLRETERFLFDNIGVDYGLLLCADDLVPFYERLGWYPVASKLYFDQPGGKKQWEANVMLLSRDQTKEEPGIIDLCGYPW